MNTIQEQWECFQAMVVPEDASAIQVQEMKRAFYGGVAAMTRIQFNLAGLSEDAGVAILEETHKELQQFTADIASGKS